MRNWLYGVRVYGSQDVGHRGRSLGKEAEVRMVAMVGGAGREAG